MRQRLFDRMETVDPLGVTGQRDGGDDVLIARDREIELGLDAKLSTDLMEQDIAPAGAAGDAGQLGGDTRLFLGDGILDRGAGHRLLVGRKARLGAARNVDPVPGEQQNMRLRAVLPGMGDARLLLEPVELGKRRSGVIGQNTEVLIQRQLPAHGLEIEVLGTFKGLSVQPRDALRLLDGEQAQVGPRDVAHRSFLPSRERRRSSRSTESATAPSSWRRSASTFSSARSASSALSKSIAQRPDAPWQARRGSSAGPAR